MAELSPAAQAIIDAIGIPLGSSLYPVAAGFSAAALRAVAAGYSENLYDQHEGKVAVVRSDLVLAIATELEDAS